MFDDTYIDLDQSYNFWNPGLCYLKAQSLYITKTGSEPAVEKKVLIYSWSCAKSYHLQ